MAHDNAPNKPVHLIYLFGALLFFVLLKWTADWIWGYFTRAPDEFYLTVISASATLILGIIFYRHEPTYTLINEVAAELKKVTWPNAKEVRQATIVVVIMTIISASVLGFFDMIWSNVTLFIYG